MLSILVTNSKGGCGKTTIATNLAGAFANTGFKTALADCDRQRSSLSWAKLRDSSAPEISVLNWTKDITPVPKKTQRLIIDAPAALRRKQVVEFLREADIVILPVLPSLFDENTTRRFLNLLDKLKPIRKGKRAVAVVGNRVRQRTNAAARLDQFLESVGQRAVTRLRDTQFYSTAALTGLSLFDVRTARAENFLQDWRPLLSFIDEISARVER